MPKEEAAVIAAHLSRPFEPFHGSVLPIGTEIQIISEEDERYIVKFPGAVGFSGSFHIQKSSVEV